jgi:hypothetical protein
MVLITQYTLVIVIHIPKILALQAKFLGADDVGGIGVFVATPVTRRLTLSSLLLHIERIKISLGRTPPADLKPADGASVVFEPRRAGRLGDETAVERREAQRARSRRFAQADCPVARAAPEARASGNIRPRGAATASAPPGAALSASVRGRIL